MVQIPAGAYWAWVLSHVPLPQSPSSQHSLLQTPTHVIPTAQKLPTALPHGAHNGASLGGSKQPNPFGNPESHTWGAAQPSFVKGLQPMTPPIVMQAPFEGEGSGASQSAALGVMGSHVSAQLDCRHASSAWNNAPVAHAGVVRAIQRRQASSASHAACSRQHSASAHGMHVGSSASVPVHASGCPVLLLAVTDADVEPDVD
jgi:hypothetical protein